MNSLENKTRASTISKQEVSETNIQDHTDSASESDEETVEVDTLENSPKGGKDRKGIFEKWAEKFKDFLDNAE
jgi:cell division protein FtsA